MATITKQGVSVTYTGTIKEGLKALPNHSNTPSNPQKPRRLTLS